MKYRETELLDRTNVGASGTKTIDVNVLDPISRIDICYHSYIYGAMQAQLGACITKIELVDGSDVLFSMSGLEAQALNIYDRRVPTMNGPFQNGGNWHWGTFGIDFGRFLWDPELAFDPTKFRNPQLKITHDQDAAYAGSTDNYMEVFAHCFDEKVISPIGFLMSKLHYAYDPLGDDKYGYIDLPTDHTIRQMLIRGYETKIDPLTVVDEARMSEENDKRVVFDINLVRYFYRMRGVWPLVREEWCEYATPEAETNNKWFTPTNYMTVPMGHSQGGHATFRTENAMRGGWMDWRGSIGLMFYGDVVGHLPNHTIALPFGDQADLASWYDAQNKGSVKLRLLCCNSCAGTRPKSAELRGGA